MSETKNCPVCKLPVTTFDNAHDDGDCVVALKREVERLKVGHERYEFVRNLRAEEFAEVANGRKQFDVVIDEMRQAAERSTT